MVAEQKLLPLGVRAMAARVPSSHGSLDGDPAEGGEGSRQPAAPTVEPEDDPFDSDEFREFLRERRLRGGRRAEVGAVHARPVGRSARRPEDDSDDDRPNRGGGAGQPPEWDGVSQTFQDWLIKCKLWLATTKAKPRTQGPLILQRLSGAPFQAFKHWAKDVAWLNNENGGSALLEAMNLPENFGEDREEDLLASLSKITYHMKRGKDESLRGFWSRWEEALQKIREHQVILPDKYIGFLLIQALGLGDADIKSLLSFTRGSIIPSEVREWARKHEMKLMAKDVGTEKDRKGTSASTRSTAGHYFIEDEHAAEEINFMEDALNELYSEDAEYEEVDSSQVPEDEILDEHEVAEVLNTMIQRKKTFVQSAKIKKAKELAHGYGNWKKNPTGSSASSGGTNQMSVTGRLKGGNYKMSLEALKATSRCSKCGQVGHWHKDPQCPKNQGRKTTQEAHYMEKDSQPTDTEEAIFCGFMEKEVEKQDHYNLVEPYVDFACDELRLPPADRLLSDLSSHEPSTAPATNAMASNSEDHLFGFESADIGAYMSGSTLTEGFGCDLGVGLGVGLKAVNREIFWSEGVGNPGNPKPHEDLCGTIDTGCQRMAIGLATLRKLQSAMPNDMEIGTIKQEYRFKSVHGTSSTTHVATIPTSLGRRGSILKPAIFTGDHSEQAPFLISLPFLMACRTVLHLDPSRGLRAYFKKFGFSVDLHIGPTGALRIPLTNFTSKQLKHLRETQAEVLQSQAEFEVLKTTAFGRDSSDPDVCGANSVEPAAHGEQQACAYRATGVEHDRRSLVQNGAQAAVPHDPHEHSSDRTTSWPRPSWPRGDDRPGDEGAQEATIQCMASHKRSSRGRCQK